MSFLKSNEILDMNNDALSFFEEGKYQKAMSLLKVAFYSLTAHLQQITNHHYETPGRMYDDHSGSNSIHPTR